MGHKGENALAMATRHVRYSQRLVARQRQIVEKLRRTGTTEPKPRHSRHAGSLTEAAPAPLDPAGGAEPASSLAATLRARRSAASARLASPGRARSPRPWPAPWLAAQCPAARSAHQALCRADQDANRDSWRKFKKRGRPPRAQDQRNARCAARRAVQRSGRGEHRVAARKLRRRSRAGRRSRWRAAISVPTLRRAEAPVSKAEHF